MRTILLSALMLFPLSTAAFSETISFYCQLQAGGGYGVNDSAQKYHSALAQEITDAGFIPVGGNRSAKTDLNLNYTVRAMNRYFGAGFSTGLMYYTGSDYIEYRKAGDSTSSCPSKYSSSFIVLPESLLAICSIPLTQTLTFTAAAGPSLYIFINSCTQTTSSNYNKADYKIRGNAARNQTSCRAGADVLLEVSYEFYNDYSYQAGTNINLITADSGMRTFCSIYMGVMLRTDFALYL